MDVQELLAPDVSAPLGRRRGRVLELLRETDVPLGVQEVAGQSGLHPNTARFHLDALVEAGLATREPQLRAAPGRPSIVYQAAGGGATGERRYRFLAEMLSSLITAMPEPAAAAQAAGREWGGYIAEEPPPYQRPDAAQAIEELGAILTELGFAPEVVPGGTRPQVLLRDCPFREVARHHQAVVCSLHLGLMQGALARMHAPVTASQLEPFASPGVCIAYLAAPEEPAPPAQLRKRPDRDAQQEEA